MQNILLIFTALLLASCNGGDKAQKTTEAIATGEKTRMEWQKALKTVEISLEDTSGNPPAWPRLGVCMDVASSTPEERESLSGAPFIRKGNRYISPDRNAVTSDTAARIHVCYPYREGVSANDTVRLNAPFGENLYGSETGRDVGSAIIPTVRLRSAMALLRIVCGSNDLRDRLEELAVIGDCLYTQGTYRPYTGRWSDMKAEGLIRAKDADCLLNNGMKHDFYLIPTTAAGAITLTVRIDGKRHALKTMLPPLPPGSLTHLSLYKGKDGLSIRGSWVETERALSYGKTASPADSVQVGHFLQADGRIQSVRDILSVAVVVETDGKHGKAVALADCNGSYVFSDKGITGGRLFPTIDGEHKEGVLNPVDGVRPEEKIIYKPGIPYPKDCALGYDDGATLTQQLLQVQEQQLPDNPVLPGRKSMLEETERHPGSYIPSLGELAWLYYQLECGKTLREQTGLTSLEGEYLSSSESGKQTAYRMDFTGGTVTGQLSKRYASAKLRLFYLF